jgi:hypothetical protein
MLSVNYIANFLAEKQVPIDNIFYSRINEFEYNKEFIKTDTKKEEYKLDKYHYNLPQSFDIIFNKSIKDFYYDSKIYKNKSPLFTLLNSIFLIGNKYYNLNSENEKEFIMKEFIKKIDNDLFQKDLYTKFNYTKNRKFNKTDIQTVIKNAFTFKHCDKLHLFKEYLSDYLGVNIYIFKVHNGCVDFNVNENYLTKYFGNNITKYVPHFVILYENEIYKPLMKINSEHEYSILRYSEEKNIIDSIWKYFKLNEYQKANQKENISEVNVEEVNISEENIEKDKNNINVNNEEKINEEVMLIKKNKYNENYLSAQKVEFIKQLCIEESIVLTKISEKTGKTINKLKKDLIDDLLKL